jgi:sugar/nucleoside kinase (ribokinase family)
VILCWGEAIVDLVCEREVDSLSEADCFAPRFGGALANVAVAARRTGAKAALAGGVGNDPWGAWLRERLADEGVDLPWFSLIPELRTPVAFVTFDHHREPSYQIYGEGIEAGIRSLAGRVEEALGAASALVFGSNTLVGEPERELTLHARDLALERGVPILFDPNLRPHRWHDLTVAIDLCRPVCDGATVVRANLAEALALADLDRGADPGLAAERICSLGARAAVVTLGAEGALVRGEARGDVDGVEVDLVSPMGAGDAFTGTLAAGLAERGWDPGRTDEALPAAVAAGAEACASWGAVV